MFVYLLHPTIPICLKPCKQLFQQWSTHWKIVVFTQHLHLNNKNHVNFHIRDLIIHFRWNWIEFRRCLVKEIPVVCSLDLRNWPVCVRSLLLKPAWDACIMQENCQVHAHAILNCGSILSFIQSLFLFIKQRKNKKKFFEPRATQTFYTEKLLFNKYLGLRSEGRKSCVSYFLIFLKILI